MLVVLRSWLLAGLLITALPVAATTPEEAALIANSAERGSAGAQVLLAVIYKDGAAGYAQNDKLAAYWFERAAEQGNAYAEQMLGDWYAQGKGVPQNLKVAADWREKAANRGNVQAQLKLGKMYLAGEGVAKDPVKAENWLNRAAVEGNSEAQYLLAKMYHAGEGVTKNRAAAGNLLAKSAAQGYEDAVKLMHFMESFGFGLEESFHSRVPDLEKLAEDGDIEAQYQLATRYETGAFGLKKNKSAVLV
jgi:TPR repeat protein